MTTNENWLDVMPAIPLASGVLTADGENPIEKMPDERGVMGWVCALPGSGGRRCWVPLDGIPDLDDPQGFGFALRWFAQRGILNDGQEARIDSIFACVPNDYKGVLARHIGGTTTDADRLVLAKAIAEVVR